MNSRSQESGASRPLMAEGEGAKALSPGVWALVANPGTDDEFVVDLFQHRSEALYVRRQMGPNYAVMLRLPDGNLTTEF